MDGRGAAGDDHGIDGLSVRDGDVAVEGHQHAIGAIESGRRRQSGRRGDPQDQRGRREGKQQTPHVYDGPVRITDRASSPQEAIP